MKLIVIFLSVFIVVFCAPEKYTTKFDNVDLDQILKSDRLLRNYINCLLDKGKCSPDGQELKLHINDALLTGCEKCSEKQKEGIKKMVRFLLENKRAYWDELEAKYDPEGTYRAKYEMELKAEGVTL